MKTVIAARLAASVILVLGGATWALAQPLSLNNVSAAVDWGQFDPAKVPDAVKNLVTEKLVTVIRPATKQCPSKTDTTPTMTVVAAKPVPARWRWPNNFTFNETGFVCRMSGVQCGFGDEPITATSSRVTVEEGILTLRCSVNVKNLQ